MPRFGEQRQRMGANTGHDQERDVGERNAERDFEHSLGTAATVRVEVHSLSVRTGRAGFKQEWVFVVGELHAHKTLRSMPAMEAGLTD